MYKLANFQMYFFQYEKEVVILILAVMDEGTKI
jgi:hypothetical protein